MPDGAPNAYVKSRIATISQPDRQMRIVADVPIGSGFYPDINARNGAGVEPEAATAKEPEMMIGQVAGVNMLVQHEQRRAEQINRNAWKYEELEPRLRRIAYRQHR